MARIIHKELSYQVVGILIAVYKEMGGGFQEKYYQRAVALKLKQNNIPFLEQVIYKFQERDVSLGYYKADFIIDSKIVLDIKSKSFFSRTDIYQMLGYLKKSELELGIIARFCRHGVYTRRILKGF